MINSLQQQHSTTTYSLLQHDVDCLTLIFTSLDVKYHQLTPTHVLFNIYRVLIPLLTVDDVFSVTTTSPGREVAMRVRLSATVVNGNGLGLSILL